MEPLFALTALATPSDFCSPWPPSLSGHSLACSKVQSAAAVLPRYLVKLSVVPDEAARCTGRIAVAGSEAPGLSAAMAAAFHLVTLFAKIFAMVDGDSWRLVTPSTL